MPTDPSTEFENELEVFRRETESAVQCFYVWRTVHEVASKDERVDAALNKAPLFWNTTLGALQTATFITLGRIFDQDQKTHNIDRVIRIGQNNLAIFSRDALAARKRRDSTKANEWLDAYLEAAHDPTHEDFRRLREYVEGHRRIYVASFRPIRHSVFAHKQVAEKSETDDLFANAKINEIQQLLVFLAGFYEALWELFFNARKPVLRPEHDSVAHMLARPSAQARSLQERITTETESFLKSIAEPGNRRSA